MVFVQFCLFSMFVCLSVAHQRLCEYVQYKSTIGTDIDVDKPAFYRKGCASQRNQCCFLAHKSDAKNDKPLT